MLALAGANHFDAIYGFEDPDSSLCQWIARISEPSN
jgi:hypothetical protein